MANATPAVQTRRGILALASTLGAGVVGGSFTAERFRGNGQGR
jgi:hypothetical protein